MRPEPRHSRQHRTCAPLLANDFVDAMSTFTVPVGLGGDKKLFADGSAPHSYKLTRSRKSRTGPTIAHGARRRGHGCRHRPRRAEKAEAARQERMKREAYWTLDSAIRLRNATPSVFHQRHIGRVLRSSGNDSADEDLHGHAMENIVQADALLLGRVT